MISFSVRIYIRESFNNLKTSIRAPPKKLQYIKLAKIYKFVIMFHFKLNKHCYTYKGNDRKSIFYLQITPCCLNYKVLNLILPLSV